MKSTLICPILTVMISNLQTGIRSLQLLLLISTLETKNRKDNLATGTLENR